ncbi:hypothetical protein L207DRAFT_218882 [Hyaloscypha variabilis F]|uniref:Uncharacterized protein n=1 Tax=Hyaloscypha variabilis (strain UAMH 11265 / GT02V1 / F) TaxID=1149755 RepID=A0A2J6S7D5_HYAVF|nr:hypothetical protein L207DRAFT_218882 [Hyaloscypha variabilis F]
MSDSWQSRRECALRGQPANFRHASRLRSAGRRVYRDLRIASPACPSSIEPHAAFCSGSAWPAAPIHHHLYRHSLHCIFFGCSFSIGSYQKQYTQPCFRVIPSTLTSPKFTSPTLFDSAHDSNL